MSEQQDRNRSSVGDELREGLRAGIGILSALKDAIEDTVHDMRDRGELSEERAKEAVRTTMDRVQTAFDDARIRFDFVPRREFEALKAEVADLRGRLARHETAHPGGTGAGAATGGPTGPTTGPAGGDIPVTES